MRLLEAFAAAFIDTFGITRPAAAHRRRTAWFIAVLLGLTIVMVAAVGYGFYNALKR